MGMDDSLGREGPWKRMPARRLPPAEAAVLLGLLATLAYRAMAQDCLHWFDSLTALTWAKEGRMHHPGHLLAMAPWSLACTVLPPSWMTPLSACRWVMALGGGVTVAAAFLAAHARGFGPGKARAAAMAAFCMPCVGYFATVVELHAVGMAAAALALWQACRMGQHDRLASRRWRWPALWCGLLCALAAALHTSLHALPLLLPWLAAAGLWPAMPWRRFVALGLRPLLLVGGAYAMAYAGLLAAVGGMDAFVNFGDLVGTGFYEEPHPASALQRLSWEFLVPFAPTSCLLVADAFCGRRRPALLLGVAMALLLASIVVLRGFRIDENGAYLLLLCVPLALRCAVVPTPQLALLLCCGLLAGAMLRWKQADVRRADPELAMAAQEIDARVSCAFLLGKGPLLDSVTLFAPELKVVAFPLQRPVDPDRAQEVVAGFEALRSLMAPRSLFIDGVTWRQWESGKYGAMQELVRGHIQSQRRPVWLSQGPLDGALIRPGDGQPR